MSCHIRRNIVIAAGALVTTPNMAFAQAATKRPRIGYLSLYPISGVPSRERQAFLDGLRELGYVPDSTITIIYASAEGEADFLESVCADLVKQGLDLIVTSGTQAAMAARNSTSSVPIVTLAAGDPIGIGLVKSLSRPGGNVTGVAFLLSELAGKRMQLLKELAPAVARVAVLWNSANPNSRSESRAAIAGARALKMEAQELPVASAAELVAALKSMEARRQSALYVTFESGLIVSHRTEIAELGLRLRAPIVSGWHFLTEAGGLLSYAPDHAAIYHRAAYYVQRILNGTKPGELPVEQARSVELVLNLTTAKVLGLNIPASFLIRANRVID